MLLRKSWILWMVVLCNSFIIPITYADIQPTDLNTAVQAIITYFNTYTTIANSATVTNSSLLNMAPPGNSIANKDVAKSVGISASAVEPTLSNILLPKELADLNWGLYATPLPGERVQGDVFNNFLANHEQYFCAPSSGVENVFGAPDCRSNEPTYQYGELKLSSLLAPTIYNSGQQALAESVIQTLTTPFPDSSISDLVTGGLAKSSDKVYVAKVMSKHAGMSAARNSLNEMYGARLSSAVGSPPQATSIISIMQTEATRRFENPAWYDAVGQSSSEALLRELVHMESYRLWTDYYRYRQNERIEALLAIMTAQGSDQALQLMSNMPH